MNRPVYRALSELFNGEIYGGRNSALSFLPMLTAFMKSRCRAQYRLYCDIDSDRPDAFARA
jgi:hypothetical protein